MPETEMRPWLVRELDARVESWTALLEDYREEIRLISAERGARGLPAWAQALKGKEMAMSSCLVELRRLLWLDRHRGDGGGTDAQA